MDHAHKSNFTETIERLIIRRRNNRRARRIDIYMLNYFRRLPLPPTQTTNNPSINRFFGSFYYESMMGGCDPVKRISPTVELPTLIVMIVK
ncbi:7114_t:CDS:2 [Rhizophagus irregularis]|nr:7114_t:CDS:2 [Rhizophagus irregularis]